MKSVARGVPVTVRINGDVQWSGPTLDVCSILLPNVALRQGENVLDLEMGGAADTTLSTSRSLGMMLFDFGVAPALPERVAPRSRPW